MVDVTIPDEATFIEFDASSVGPHAFNWTYFAKADIHISINGVEIGQGDFTHIPNTSKDGGYDGGSITLNSAVSGGAGRLWRVVQTVRTDNYSPGPLSPQSISRDMAKQTAMAQDARRDITRAPKMPLGTAGGDIPTPIAGRVLGWLGGAWDWVSSVPSPIVSSFMASALLTTSAHAFAKVVSGSLSLRTYAQARLLTGLSVDVVYRVKGVSAVGDGGAGDFYFDASDTTTADDGGTCLVVADGGRLKRSYRRGDIDAAWWGLKAGDDSAAAANVTAITAAMIRANADGGAIVHLPPTLSGVDLAINSPIDNCYDNVIVRGAAASDIHDAPGSQPGTALKCTAAITALKLRSPYNIANARKACLGFDKITIVGLQTRVLEIDSIRRGYVDISFSGCAGTEAVLVKNGVSFTDLAESADTQRFDFFRVRGYLGATGADGVVLTGASNANTSLIKQGMIIDIVHYNGHQLRIKNADNIIAEIMGFRLPGGTGRPYYCHGTNAGAATFTSDIEIRGFGGGYIEGTEVAGTTVPAQVLQHGLDITNSATMPTIGTGARLWLQDNFGRIYYLQSAAPAAFGASYTESEQARSAAGANTPITFRSNAADGLRFTNGTQTFVLRINSDGYAELLLAAGSTGFNITGNMRLNGAAVTVGANDSGGAGYRVLRIPN